MSQQSKVSCLCLTRDRPKYLHRAIRCFQRQTWNNKELVIVYDFDDKRTIKLLEHFKNQPNIKCVKNGREGVTVGRLRNMSVNHATGEYVMQWDDDDFYENNRITFMMNSIKGTDKPAVVLNSWYCVFVNKKTVRRSNPYTYEGSIIAKRETLRKYKYPNCTRKKEGGGEIGEDTIMLRKLISRKLLKVVSKPTIYYYFIHGTNTCSPQHFRSMFRASRTIPGSARVYRKLMERIKRDDDIFSKLMSK